MKTTMGFRTAATRAIALRQEHSRQGLHCCFTTAALPRNDGTIYTPILIVGAGPSGLLLSHLLSSYGTPSTVLEAAPSPTKHPQAHFLNTRTMEVLRHCLPSVHDRVLHAMPLVDQWKYFRFGYDMNNNMAQVVHPVDRPLQANADANGKLVAFHATENTAVAENTFDAPLSACRVGHLAQHTFCNILLETEAPHATVKYNMPVVGTDYENGMHHVHTKDGTTYATPVVVAADGAHSTLRQLWGIPMQGQEAIQHLVNVHIRTTNHDNMPAMLYSIWNPQLVGMMVCHSRGEYVLQIPYFPPYQSMERNFTPPQVRTMVEAAFGHSDLSIESIRPWTMNSLIAQRYCASDRSGGVLVGDAAHLFPPAGGFGMNTGLQDVHNLAWRLSWWHENPSCRSLPSLLSLYEKERRPIAQRNAALSVRNFRRILTLTKACYLNDQHPTALVRLLDQMTFVPLSARQTLFQSLLETAMWPLSVLKNPSSLHTKHVTRNVRRILEQGGGLPLLFPKYELGFGYTNGNSPTESEDSTQDSMGYEPSVKIGYLLPHVELQVENYSNKLYPNLQLLKSHDETETNVTRITSSDLSSQLRVGGPCFALLLLNECRSPELVSDVVEAAKTDCGVEIRTVQVICPTEEKPTVSSYDLVVRDVDSKLSSMVPTNDSVMILIRPDGHVASIVALEDGADEFSVKGKENYVAVSPANMTKVLLRGVFDSLRSDHSLY